jgi:hypothetical protein
MRDHSEFGRAVPIERLVQWAFNGIQPSVSVCMKATRSSIPDLCE